MEPWQVAKKKSEKKSLNSCAAKNLFEPTFNTLLGVIKRTLGGLESFLSLQLLPPIFISVFFSVKIHKPATDDIDNQKKK